MTAPRKIIVLTGVTRGLGRALAEEFIREGHVVCGCGRSREVIEQMNLQHRGPHHFAAVDVGLDLQVKAWARSLLESHGAPDLLINNAGVIHEPMHLWDLPSSEFSRVVDVNIKGTANVIRHFVPAMIKRRAGMIVNFSSGWGRDADAYMSAYCASKWAIEGMTRSLAEELPPGLGAVALNPGIIDTDMLRRALGSSSSVYPKADAWVRTALPYVLGLTADHNGASLTVGDGKVS